MDEIWGKESYNEVIFLLEMENSKMDLKQILKLVRKFLNGFSPAIQGPLFLFIKGLIFGRHKVSKGFYYMCSASESILLKKK